MPTGVPANRERFADPISLTVQNARLRLHAALRLDLRVSKRRSRPEKVESRCPKPVPDRGPERKVLLDRYTRDADGSPPMQSALSDRWFIATITAGWSASPWPARTL